MNKIRYNLIKWAVVFSGLSVFIGVGALILESVIFPIILENYIKRYAPLPYPVMVYSFIELVLLIICTYKNERNVKKIIVCIVLMVVAYEGMNNCYVFLTNSDNRGYECINYEYRQLYSIIFSIVNNSERFLNMISALLTSVLLGVMVNNKYSR